MKTLIQVTLSLLVLASARVVAGPPAVDRLCEGRDLTGTWEIVRLDVIQKPRYANSPLYYKYQKRIFRTDGKTRHFVGAGPLTPEQEREISKTPDNVEFEVGAGGIVGIRVAGRETDRFRCVVLPGGELEFTWPESGPATLIQRFRKSG